MAAETANRPHLRVSDLVKTYASAAGDLPVLRGVSLEAAPGDTVAVVGASGSGKSTLLNLIGALDRPTSGGIMLGDVDVAALDGDRLADYRRTRVGFVFQDHHLLPECTVWENVLLPLVTAGGAVHGSPRAEELLVQVGLAGRRDELPQRLSGGERQRVAVARALVNNPPLVLCDEPTGSLDRDTARAVGELFIDLARRHGSILIVVTHNLELAGRCSRQLELRDGQLHPPAPSAGSVA
jgi:lipoprotein-releasing system ATP-binding protein